jgi:DNA-binding NtrC family response regulator
MTSTFLLISHQEKSAWSQFLSEALAPLGSLKVASEEEVDTEVLQADYDLVILDAAAVTKVDMLVSGIRAHRRDLRIVVVTLTPTWWEARAVLRVGAVDYLSRSLTQKEFSSTVEEMLKVPILAWSDAGAPKETANATILFADNDPDFLATRKEFLEQEGYFVIPAQTTVEAERVLDQGNVDLAILDLRLVDDDDEKDISGLTLAKALAYRDIPKIILTGFPSHEVVRGALREGLDSLRPVVDLLAKEEGPQAMLTAVSQALSASGERKGITSAMHAGVTEEPIHGQRNYFAG